MGFGVIRVYRLDILFIEPIKGLFIGCAIIEPSYATNLKLVHLF